MCHSHPAVACTVQSISSALYVPHAVAEKLLLELKAAGVVGRAENGGYRYSPRDAALASSLQELFDCYQSNLVGITNLIHDTTQRSAERFSNAFKLKKEP